MNNYYISKFDTVYWFKPAKKKHRVIEDINILYKWLTQNDFPDWHIRGEFPGGYFALMFECEGGTFANGTRVFHFFPLLDIPKYYEEYDFAKYMPFALPFAQNENGDFYIFDFRKNNPCIYTVNPQNLGWEPDKCIIIAENFDKLVKFK